MDEQEYNFFLLSKETNFLQDAQQFRRLVKFEIYKPLLFKCDLPLLLKFLNYIVCKFIQKIVEIAIQHSFPASQSEIDAALTLELSALHSKIRAHFLKKNYKLLA